MRFDRCVQPCREISLDLQVWICEIVPRAGAELLALSDARPKRTLGRIATLAVLGFCMLGAAGWLAIRETPAAQRLVETIKPYDPLQ